jgi:hypothetical protein
MNAIMIQLWKSITELTVNASLAAYFDNLIEDGAITQNKAHRHSWYDGY